MKFQTLSIIKQLMKAKKEENPSLFQKAMTKFQEVGENITAKTLAEVKIPITAELWGFQKQWRIFTLECTKIKDFWHAENAKTFSSNGSL